MPLVQTFYSQALAWWEDIKPVVFTAVRQSGTVLLSCEDHKLTEEDFRFLPSQAGDRDELGADIMIVVHLDAHPARTDNCRADDNSAAIAERIVIRLRILAPTVAGLTIDVSLLHSQMGWATATV